MERVASAPGLPVAVFLAYNSDVRHGRGAVRRVIWFLSPTPGDGQARVAATYKKTRSRIDRIDRIDRIVRNTIQYLLRSTGSN